MSRGAQLVHRPNAGQGGFGPRRRATPPRKSDAGQKSLLMAPPPPQTAGARRPAATALGRQGSVLGAPGPTRPLRSSEDPGAPEPGRGGAGSRAPAPVFDPGGDPASPRSRARPLPGSHRAESAAPRLLSRRVPQLLWILSLLSNLSLLSRRRRLSASQLQRTPQFRGGATTQAPGRKSCPPGVNSAV